MNATPGVAHGTIPSIQKVASEENPSPQNTIKEASDSPEIHHSAVITKVVESITY